MLKPKTLRFPDFFEDLNSFLAQSAAELCATQNFGFAELPWLVVDTGQLLKHYFDQVD